MPANSFLRRSLDSGAEIAGYATYHGAQLVQQDLPPMAEAVRRNLGWQVMNTAAVAALVVRPSTAAHGTLYNNNTTASGIALVVTKIFAFNLVTTAAISAWSTWACVHPTGRAADAADITAFKSMSGLATAYPGGARFDNGATVTDDGWFPVSPAPSLTGGVTTAPGGAKADDVLFIIPPTAAISVAPVATIVGLTFTVGFQFLELVLPVGGI
jgi:hypothetical protein